MQQQIIEDAETMHLALRRRADELGIARLVIDDLAKLATGHTSKALARPPIKRMTLKTCLAIARSLGLRVVLAEDEAALSEVAQYIGSRHDEKITNAKWIASQETAPDAKGLDQPQRSGT